MLGVPGQYTMLPLYTAAMQSPYPAVVVILLARGPGGSAWAKSEGVFNPLRLVETTRARTRRRSRRCSGPRCSERAGRGRRRRRRRKRRRKAFHLGWLPSEDPESIQTVDNITRVTIPSRFLVPAPDFGWHRPVTMLTA